MGALSASINVPSSILSTGGEAGSSSAVGEEGAPAPSSAANVQSGSALDGFGGKKEVRECENRVIFAVLHFQTVSPHLKIRQDAIILVEIIRNIWIRPVF